MIFPGKYNFSGNIPDKKSPSRSLNRKEASRRGLYFYIVVSNQKDFDYRLRSQSAYQQKISVMRNSSDSLLTVRHSFL